nr:hypothetical protein [Tanacetum cinerariifolium]
MKELQLDDKLNFVEEAVEVMDREVKQLKQSLDRKKVIITESTIRRDLQLEDAEGVDCLPYAAIFEQLTLIGKPRRKVTKVTQPSDPTKHVADEDVNEEMDDSLERAATTATSSDAEQDRGNIFKTQSKATPNESSSQRTNLGGGPKCQETMGDTIAHTRMISVIDADEGVTLVSTHDDAEMFDADKDLRGEEVFVAKQDKNVAEKEVDAAQVQVITASTTLTILIDKVTLAQALAELKHTKPKAKAKGIVFHEPEESTTTTTAIPKLKS